MFSNLLKGRTLLGIPVLLVVLVVAAACAAAPEPIVVEKEVIVEVEKQVVIEKEVIVEKEVVKEIPKDVIVEKEVQVIKEVPKEVIVVKEVEKQVIVEKEVIKEVEKPVLVEREVAVETIKEVVVEKEVEKLVEVTFKKKETATPIVSSIRWSGAAPTTYSEHPTLAAMVKAGQLPAVSERIPSDPGIMHGPDGVGKYGSTIRDIHRSGDFRNCCLIYDGLVDLSVDGIEIEPHHAKGWVISNGFKTMTFNLRKGMKWSDGAPFGADDYMFGFQQTIANKELMPNAPSWSYGIFGELPDITKVDDHTFTFDWPEPFPGFLRNVQTNWRGAGAYNPHATGDALAYIPKHYMQQFTKGFATDADLAAKVKAGGYEDWTKMFRRELKYFYHPDGQVPVVGPWMNHKGSPDDQVWTLRANPYFWEIDSAGNQVPYIYEFISQYAKDGEIANLKMIAGESDFQYRYVDQQKLTIFMLNRDKSGYRVSMVPSRRMDATVIFNMTYDLDPELAKWYRTKDFRHALAVSIDRETINNSVFFGMGEVGGYSPPSFSYYKLDPEWATKYGTYEPELAKSLLDGLGLKKDSEGFYLRSDGKGRLRPVLRAHQGGGGQTDVHVNYTTIVVENWRAIGIDAVLNVANALPVANHEQMTSGGGDTDPWLSWVYPICSSEVQAFIDTKGAEGIDPNSREELKPCAEAWELHKKGSQATSRLEQVNYAKQLIELTVDNIYGIGIVKGNPSGKGQMLILNKDIRNVLNQPRTDRHAFRMELYYFDTLTGDSETH